MSHATEPTSDARQYRIIIRGECGRLLVSLIGNVEVESAQAARPPRPVAQSKPRKLLAAIQNSLPSGSCMTVHRWPRIWCFPMTAAPSCTSLLTASGSASTKSRANALACFGSGTLLKYQAGSRRSPSAPPWKRRTRCCPYQAGGRAPPTRTSPALARRRSRRRCCRSWPPWQPPVVRGQPRPHRVALART